MTVGVIATATTTGYADPGPNPRRHLVPASGSVPVASTPLVVPAPQPEPTLPAAAGVGPLAKEIIAASATTQRLGEQVKALQDDLATARAATGEARADWERAVEALALNQAFGDQVGVPAIVTPSEPPTSAPATQPPAAATPGAPETSPVPDPSPEGSATPEAPADPAEVERQAAALLDGAIAAEKDVASRHAVVLEQFQRHSAALQVLTDRNNDQLAAAQRARDEYEASLAASRSAGTAVSGLRAAPAALDAVAFALSQLGKPYIWATQGPNTYDCSGLVLASYLSVGIKMPRVANNQYGAGVPVPTSQLLPGDLIFFSNHPQDWRQIYHVAIYIGHGKMVHAPSFGDVVKVSPIWWTEFFGATRMVAAVPVPAEPTPAPSPSDSTSPSPEPSPSTSATPSPDTTPTPSPVATSGSG
jgi:cell wall-associated NlpC family hydrolase